MVLILNALIVRASIQSFILNKTELENEKNMKLAYFFRNFFSRNRADYNSRLEERNQPLFRHLMLCVEHNSSVKSTQLLDNLKFIG